MAGGESIRKARERESRNLEFGGSMGPSGAGRDLVSEKGERGLKCSLDGEGKKKKNRREGRKEEGNSWNFSCRVFRRKYNKKKKKLTELAGRA